MADVNIMHQIQSEKRKEIDIAGDPTLTAETARIKCESLMTIDEPPTEAKVDPLR